MRKLMNRQVVIYALCIAVLFIMGIEIHQRTYAADQKPATSDVASARLTSLQALDAWNRPSFHPYIIDATLLKTPSASITLEQAMRQQHVLEQTQAASVKEKENAAANPVLESVSTTTSSTGEKANKMTLTAKAAEKDIATKTDAVTGSLYEVTAFYLNVRSEPDASSDILDVVKQETLLHIIQELDNGWLKLQGEGYINGHYAKKASLHAAAQKKPEVKQVSAAKNITKKAEAKKESVKTLSVKQEKLNKPTSKVSSSSGLTEEHIARMFKGTALANQDLEEAVLQVEADYGVNAYFTIAVMKLESGNGKSRLAKEHNNLFGLNATGGSNRQAFRFDEKKDSVEKFGQLISRNYVKKGYTSVEKVAGKYCPVNPEWPDLVTSIMNSDYRKLRDTF